MPNFQAQATAIRASGYSIRCYASFYAPDPIIEATCSLASPSFPLAVLFVNIDTGDYTDILPGMRVDVLDSTATYLKARTRIRFGNTITDTVFPVREFSQASLDIAVGDRVFVYPDVRLADKLVEATVLFSPDGTPYSDQGSNPPPLACSGGHWAGRVDDGETFATVPMTGSASEVVDPDSTPGNVSHLWTLPSGVAFQAGSADSDADPILEANVGQHLILHTVTDDDNSKTITQVVVVIVTDDSTPPHRILVTSYEGKPEAGFNWEVEVVGGSVDTTSIPDGCLCILWSRERINNAWQSIRNNSDGREHILAVGYVRRERTRRAADGVNHLSFEFVSPLARLREITAYSKVMEENASPDAWNELKTLGVKRAYLQLLQFYSTLVESGFDLLIDDDFLDERYPAFYLQRSTIAGMLDELAHGQDARTTCDRTGQFSLHTEPPFIPYDDRSGITVAWALTARDILDVEVNIDHYPTVELYKTSGFSGGASGNTPYFSLYPGDAPGEGTQTPTRDRLIVDATTPQDDLNERTGRYGALADRVLTDDDGNRTPAAEVTLTLRGAYNFVDFRKEYVTLTDDYGRRLFSAARFYPTDVSVAFDERGAATTRVTLLQETNAAAGATFIPAEQAVPPYTPPILTPIPLPNPSLTPRIPSWGGVDQLPARLVCLASASAQFGYATWNSGAPVWVENSTGFGGSAGYHLLADPYDYRRYFACMSDAFYRSNDPKGGSAWASVAGWATIFGDAARFAHYGEGSINRKGYFVLANGANVVSYTGDYGGSWNVVPVYGAASYGTALSTTSIDIAVSPYNSGSTGWVYAMIGSPFGGTVRLLRSPDWGATWSTRASGAAAFVLDTNQVPTPRIIVPYIRADGSTPNTNDASQELYLATGSNNRSTISFSQDAGATWTRTWFLNASGSVRHVAGSYAGKSLHAFTRNGALLSVATYSDTGVRYSTDRGTNASMSAGQIISGGANDYANLNGSPVHSQFLVYWVRTGNPAANAQRIHWTADATATDNSFDSPAFFTGDRFCANVQVDISDLVPPA